MRLSHVLVALCFAAAPLAAQAWPGCVPCSSCVTPWCWRSCSPSCWPITPDNIIVSGDACRYSGASFGPSAASSACGAARATCSRGFGSSAPNAALGAIGPTTLSQCSNIALGACQQGADVWRSPCAGEASVGYGSCDAATFRAIFKSAATGSCTAYAQTVTGVTPGTNNWQPQPWIIGSSAPGGSAGGSGGAGGLGSAAPSVVGSAAPSGDDDNKGDDAPKAASAGGRRLLRAA